MASESKVDNEAVTQLKGEVIQLMGEVTYLGEVIKS